MSFLSDILGSSKLAEKAADGLYKGMDAAFLTDEERLEMKARFLKLYEPFKKIQRFLALVIGGAYVGAFLWSVLLYSISIFFEPCVEEVICKAWQLKQTAREIAEMNNKTLGYPFGAIITMFFTCGAAEGVIRTYADNKK